MLKRQQMRKNKPKRLLYYYKSMHLKQHWLEEKWLEPKIKFKILKKGKIGCSKGYINFDIINKLSIRKEYTLICCDLNRYKNCRNHLKYSRISNKCGRRIWRWISWFCWIRDLKLNQRYFDYYEEYYPNDVHTTRMP